MYCTQCGTKIEDGYKFCPGCGAPVEQGAPADNRSELDRIADDIYVQCPNDQYKGIALIRERTGMDLKTARDIMFIRYHGATPKELDIRKKLFKREKSKRIFGTDKCPKCGSKHIDSYCEQGISVTSEVDVFGGMLITHPGNINQGLKCLYCGYTWNPYKKR